MKMAIFVEGQTEEIFIHDLLENYFTPGKIEIVSTKYLGKNRLLTFKDTTLYAKHLCLIVDAGGDESVLSVLKENYTCMMRKGFTVFFGLRDLKSKEYKKFGEAIIQKSYETIDKLSNREKIYFHFAKMEIEAWFLAVPQLFTKIDPCLTIEKIEEIIGENLQSVDPEVAFANPTKEISKIFYHIGLSYSKSKDDAHRIVSRIDWAELCFNIRAQKISYFDKFLDDLEKVIP